jgi:FkbM family methyltransferase
MIKLLPARANNKPQYVLHPIRAARRAMYRFSGARGAAGREVVTLPWGLPLEVVLSDQIGYSIFAGGVFDPCVTETLYRLIEPGDTVVDVGANIGYLTSLAARRAGPGGEVIALEPHPGVFAMLSANVSRWDGAGVAKVEPRQLALSDKPGEGELAVGPLFEMNMGLASLRAEDDGHVAAGEQLVTVEMQTLDQLIGDRRIGVLKVDVEGHEPAVLAGAVRLLAEQRVRDIVFEDHEPYPSPATQAVERAGYSLYAIDNDLLGAVLLGPSERGEAPPWPGPSYLATSDPQRAHARMRPRWWQTPGILPWPLGRGS